VTFDQPLNIKVREIVATAEPGSELLKTIIHIEGFHLLISFLESIGYIMAGSELKEALIVMYAPNSVDKKLNGQAYATTL